MNEKSPIPAAVQIKISSTEAKGLRETKRRATKEMDG
jgi:hypothetical protein